MNKGTRDRDDDGVRLAGFQPAGRKRKSDERGPKKKVGSRKGKGGSRIERQRKPKEATRADEKRGRGWWWVCV